MKEKLALSRENKLVVIGLTVATAGVIIQIVSGVPYPKVPPVFFIQLIPIALVIFAPRRWTPIVIIVAGLFLTIGLFASGASVRLFNIRNFGGSVGLWIQMLGVFAATIAGFFTLKQNLRVRTRTS